MENLFQDIRYGVRMLRKNPAFTLVAVLTLSLGIGANTAMFTLINALLIRSLPVQNPGQLVVIGNPEAVHDRWHGTPTADFFSVPLYRDFNQSSAKIFSGMLASGEVHRVRVAGQSGEITPNATGVLVSGNYFSVLELQPFIGHFFVTEGAKGANPVAVVSYSFWKDKLGGDTNLVGQTLRLNGRPYTVLGVAPPGFFGDTVGDAQDLWVPLSMQRDFIPGRDELEDFSASWLHLIGRLRPGVPLGAAKAVLNGRFQQLVEGPLGARSASDREELKKETVEVSPGGRGFSELRGYFFKPLMLLTGLVTLLLVMACVNVANLLLARAAGRTREFAVRTAIGAPPGRLVRQLLTESIVLSAIGGAVGFLAAHWATAALIALSGDNELDSSPDLRVLLFTTAACVITGFLFGLIPALRARRVAVTPALKSQEGSEDRPGSFWNWGRVLVAFQISVSVLVLFAAGLLSRSLRNMRHVDLGYSREHILVISADPLAGGYAPARIAGFGDEIIARLAAIPGVRAATYSTHGLFSGGESSSSVKVQGFVPKSEEDLHARADYVGPGYFSALGVPILLGRDIGPQDNASSHRVAVINQSMAKFYFGNTSPVGQQFTEFDPRTPQPPVEIVGVAEDIRDHTLTGPIVRRFYTPLAQRPLPAGVEFEIRTAANPLTIADAVRREIKKYDANVPVYTVRSLDEILDRYMTNDILLARLSGFFGLLALALACVGLYGVMSYTVNRRTREIGVRMALGAQRTQVLRMVLQEALKLAVIGIAVGIPAALLASRVFSSMLFGLSPSDPLSMAIVILVLGAIAAIAGLIPARRATKVDPMVALRYE